MAEHYQIGYFPEYAYEFESNQPSKVTPLNMECPQDTSKKWIFLVEGEFDALNFVDIALSTQNCDFSAISVNSANNLPRFMEEYICKSIQKNVGLIIALDKRYQGKNQSSG